MKKFKEAKKATEEMFNEEEKKMNEEKRENEPVKNQEENVKEEKKDEQKSLKEAVEAAEAATAALKEKDSELRMIMSEMDKIMEENMNLKKVISELSKKNSEMLTKDTKEMPILDINMLSEGDDETAKRIQMEYAIKMGEYVKQEILDELSGVIKEAKAGICEREKNEILNVLADIPELSGIKDMLPQLERIIANNKALSADEVPTDEKYITAYAIARGVNAINTPQKELTAQELFELYEKNGELQDMIEKKRISETEKGQQVPPFSASSGALNAALNIKEKPKTFEEASQLTRKLFGE